MAEEWKVFQRGKRSQSDDAKALGNAGDKLSQWGQTRGLRGRVPVLC